MKRPTYAREWCELIQRYGVLGVILRLKPGRLRTEALTLYVVVIAALCVFTGLLLALLIAAGTGLIR